MSLVDVSVSAPALGPIGTGLEELWLSESMAASVASVVRFVIAFVIVYFVGRYVLVPLVSRSLDRRKLDAHAQKPLLMITQFGVIFLAVAIAFGVGGFGNFLVSMAGIAAAGTLALGFALQNVIANFVAGVFIYVDKPFKIGDWIEWDDHAGIVEDISLRVTRVRTFDNELLTVPNTELTNGVLKNPVHGDKLRLKFVFGIGYDDDIQQATDIIVEEAEDHPDIMDDPAPSVRLTELGDSDVGLQSRFWIAQPGRADVVRVRGEYVTAVKRRFDEAGIDIPYPVRTLEGGVELDGARVAEGATN